MGTKSKASKKTLQGGGSESEDEESEDKDGNHSDSRAPINAIIKDMNCAAVAPSANWWMDREVERDIKDIIKQFKKN